MALTDLIEKGKGKFYDVVFKGATAFPYSNDLMHIGMIGSIPYLCGKYGSEFLGSQFPILREHSTEIGFASAVLAEVLWQTIIEPGSAYDHPDDKFSDYKGIIETIVGASLTYFITR